tara:strand:+ start:318 stop:431 length:114 start_codon:yes stop_codon:yes gene_type:complete
MTLEERVEKLFHIVDNLNKAVTILFQMVKGDSNEPEE